jgi:ribosomal protein S18 acetylase RimI-like enzyme
MVRLALSEDRDAVVALWEACDLTRPWNDARADFQRAVDGASSDILLLELAGPLAATAMVGDDGHRGWVYYLAVAPEFQKQGLGRKMMEAAEHWLRERDARKIQLMVRDDNEEAISFYKALGYEVQPVVTIGRRLD